MPTTGFLLRRPFRGPVAIGMSPVPRQFRPVVLVASLNFGAVTNLQVQAQNRSQVETAWFLDAVHAPRNIRSRSAERSLTIAIGDDGVHISHRELAGFIWRNRKEIPANNMDDDGNGYVDDVHGWDVGDGNNTLAPPPRQPRPRNLSRNPSGWNRNPDCAPGLW